MHKSIDLLHVGRENNFNLLRFLAAFTVLVAHSYPLAGAADFEPLRGRFGMSIGTMAVDVFFVTSGFLVTESLLRARSAIAFVVNRALRIYPALVVLALISSYMMGPMVTTLPVDAYMTNADSHYYFVKTATLLTGIGWVLPGVFRTNPFPDIVNGSLWTLPYEVEMYAALMGVWLCVATITRTAKSQRIFLGLVALIVIVCACSTLAYRATQVSLPPRIGLAYMFFCGSLMYLLRRQVSLVVWPLLLAAAIALPCVLVRQTTMFQFVYILILPYAVIFLALVPSGKIRQFNRIGDYSYGVYVYAFPVQQVVAYAVPGIVPRDMLAASAILTLVLAVASWHLVEQPALRLKRRLK